MIRTCYRRQDGSVARDLDRDGLRRAVESGEGVLWVDLEEASREDGTILSDVFKFHHLAIDDCFNRHLDPAKIDDYDGYIFVIAQAINYHAASEHIEASELDLFLGANYVVSFHDRPLRAVDAVRRRIDEDGPEFARGADFLAHALLDALVDDYQPAVDELDETLAHVEERALAETKQEILQEILLLKRNVQRLRRMVIPQRDVVNRLSRGEFPHVIRRETGMYFRDIYDHVVRVEQLVESVRDLADGVLSTYLSAVNNRMNEVMKTLSVVSTIILPLTFIASIYGMNFEHMPELSWRFGYLYALLLMAAVAFSTAAFFRIRSWF